MVDVLDTIKNILTDNWNSSNTDNITPVIGKVFDYKELDITNNDYVLIYESGESHRPFAIGGQTFEQSNTVSIDIRTTYKGQNTMDNIRPHLIKMQDEVLRIIKAKLSNPDSNFQLLLPTRKLDFSDKNIGIGRMVFDCNIKKWG